MDKRSIGLLITVSGIIGYLLSSDRVRWFAIKSRPFSEGYSLRAQQMEAASMMKFWESVSIASALVAAVGILIIVISYNRIRRNRQANGRQSDIDHR